MRRILYAIVAGLGIGMLSGCACCHSCSHTHGVCDCDQCDDPCYTRAPWSGSGNVIHDHKQMPNALPH